MATLLDKLLDAVLDISSRDSYILLVASALVSSRYLVNCSSH